MSKILTVNLPDIGEGVVEGEVIEWLKSEGESVQQDEHVVVVMTDKATVELPSPYPGVLHKRYFNKGEIARVHHPLYDIEIAKALDSSHPNPEVKSSQVAQAPLKVDMPKSASQKALASPAVRQFAKQLGVDLAAIVPTGKEGQVTIEDVKNALSIVSSVEILAFEDDKVEPLSGIRALMADAMAKSHRIIPHFSYFEQLDVTALKERKESYFKKATLMPFYIHALSEALKKFPLVNSCLDEVQRRILIHARQNIGIAMDTPYGLIVPVLKNVEKMSFDQIVEAYDILKQKAKTGQLASSDMKEATITVTNFGTLGGFAGTPIIPHPNVAILGLGKIEWSASIVEGAIVPREKQMICWSFDHRLIDGAVAAKLSSTFTKLLT